MIASIFHDICNDEIAKSPFLKRKKQDIKRSHVRYKTDRFKRKDAKAQRFFSKFVLWRLCTYLLQHVRLKPYVGNINEIVDDSVDSQTGR